MLTRIRKNMEEREEGFTLVELLVVVIIIGILAAIAIPTFLNQRQGAWERAVESDLRNAAVLMETEYSETGTYAGVAGFKVSENVTVAVATGDATAYCLDGTHANLTNGWRLDSTVGFPEEAACP